MFSYHSCLLFSYFRKLRRFYLAVASGATPIFSSSGAASGAVSSKLDAEVPKVAEKDALRYLKTFFVSFVLKYANKEKKTLGQSPCANDPLSFFEIAQNLEQTALLFVICDGIFAPTSGIFASFPAFAQ